MTEPTTEAGKRLIGGEMHDRLLISLGAPPELDEDALAEAISEVEAEARESDPICAEACAEAVAAERARLAKAVRGLEGYDALWDGGDLCARAAVLAIVEKP